MSSVFWDTILFIHLFESYGALSERVIRLRRATRQTFFYWESIMC